MPFSRLSKMSFVNMCIWTPASIKKTLRRSCRCCIKWQLDCSWAMNNPEVIFYARLISFVRHYVTKLSMLLLAKVS